MNEEFIPPSIQPEVPEPKKELTPEEKKENRNPLFLGILVVVIIFGGFLAYKIFFQKQPELAPSPTEIGPQETKEQHEVKPIDIEPQKEPEPEIDPEPEEDEEPEEEEEKPRKKINTPQKIKLNGEEYTLKVEVIGDHQNVYLNDIKFLDNRKIINYIPAPGTTYDFDDTQTYEYSTATTIKDLTTKEEYLVFYEGPTPSMMYIVDKNGNILFKTLHYIAKFGIIIITDNIRNKPYSEKYKYNENEYALLNNKGEIAIIKENKIYYIDFNSIIKDNKNLLEEITQADVHEAYISNGKVLDKIDTTFINDEKTDIFKIDSWEEEYNEILK